ncbi:hypothetical protein M4I33_00295 [Clostridium sp. LY3-2]|uniref:hypothetical protein n=1 Tax=Clostridium sp. LY3-2 TaxID=2942482 RepID=UPI00215305EA|nr:hypothetical protein [Clostridium sp. LY3-2]MCR6513318.1 hypothetical protein [Clostridium sp. LY3-2]
MKKKVSIIVALGVILMLLFNFIIFFSFNSLENELNKNNNTRYDIENLAEFRNDVVEMAQMQKLWVSTNNNYYEGEFQKKVQEVNEDLKRLEKSNQIIKDDSESLRAYVDEYVKLAYKFKPVNKDSIISKEMERQFLESNKIQIEILKKSSNSVVDINNNIEERNNLILDKNDIEKNILRALGAFVTFLFSLPLYFLKKLNKGIENLSDNDTIDKIVNIYDKNLENNKNNNDSYKNLDIIIDKDKDEIDNRKIKCKEMLIYSEEIYEEAIRQDERLNQCFETLSKIEVMIHYLKEEIKIIDGIEDKDSKIRYIEDIEEEFGELKILFKTLPSYNSIIINMSKKNKI